ncbi:MAG: 6-phosphogluconolactonase [Gammaproteobacteria bacterium]|nr:6-phosphogluconolactonase [Gammaproteobacteria bacterium]
MEEAGMANNIHFKEYKCTQELDTALAERIADLLRCSLQQDSEASLVLSGGRTPLGLFEQLSNKSLLWENTLVTLADDRWVDSSHQDSNERLVRERFLINQAQAASFISLKNSFLSASEGVLKLEEEFPPIKLFSAIVLGMGGDGHTASLFPGTESLDLGLDLDSSRNFISSVPNDAPHERVSMTAPRLLASKEILIHIVGREKKEVLDRALSGKDIHELPIRLVLNQSKVPVTIFWSP